ncbi:AMP-binding protein [Curvibacter sp. RS43]|uniref:class I adenylate-forming enzyme family protein n=1 Tax=Curvibacter microcysteis TaxID=3026419 RepID=UPI002360CDC3|nr:AMP-binding protein [Curvibacter sp. RS43]MDD0808996.1 AMP-binding protein [Curvibacter sp. RS43]
MYLTQGLHRSLQRHPDKPALRHLTDGGVREHSFAQLLHDTARHAAALQARGVQGGDRVALLAPNHDLLVRALFACWWLGAVACPLNVRWSAPEVAYAVEDSGATLLVVDESLAPLAQGLPLSMIDLAQWAQEAEGQSPVPDLRVGGDALAAILYTGGTTGRSKGVMLSHANFWSASMTRGAELNNAPEAVSLLVAPLFHVAGLGRLVGQTLVGGTCVTMAHFKPAAVLQAIEQQQISDMVVVPTMLQSLLDEPSFSPPRVRSLNRIAFGAAPMPPDLLRRALQAWPQAEFFQAYGLTETAGAVCINLPHNHRDPEALAQGRLNSVGRAGLGAEILIVDESGRELPPGQVGEIVVRGPMVTRGYWHLPQASADALRGGWFHTGDAGRMDAQGYLFIVDRLKDMIISGGENVYCAEVESVLRTHPLVSQAAVIGLPDPHWGEVVHAVLVPVAGTLPEQLPLQDLRDWCREQLAGYKCPRGLSLVPALPLSAAGKVLKTVLRQQLAA